MLLTREVSLKLSIVSLRFEGVTIVLSEDISHRKPSHFSIKRDIQAMRI
jgi:hypothetical protein